MVTQDICHSIKFQLLLADSVAIKKEGFITSKMRFTKASLLAFLVIFGLSALILLFGNLQNSLAVQNERIDRFQKDGHEKQENIDDNKLVEIESLLHLLHRRLDDNSKKMDKISNIEVLNSDKDSRTNSLPKQDETPKLLPLDFTKVSKRTVRNLTLLMETPSNLPEQPIGVPMNKMPYMIDPNYKPSVSSHFVEPIIKSHS